jgi:RimJ/RimL family protein N-acetyltransferase
VIPTLRTERLILREPVLDDFAGYAEMLGSERSRFMGGPFGVKLAWGMFTSDLAMWSLFGHGCLMIDLAENGVCVGQVGINHGPLFPEKELGWMLYQGYEGRGYATEAGQAMLDWARAEPHIATLVSYFDPDNSKSMAVSRRLGGVPDPTAPKQDPEDEVYRYFRR